MDGADKEDQPLANGMGNGRGVWKRNEKENGSTGAGKTRAAGSSCGHACWIRHCTAGRCCCVVTLASAAAVGAAAVAGAAARCTTRRTRAGVLVATALERGEVSARAGGAEWQTQSARPRSLASIGRHGLERKLLPRTLQLEQGSPKLTSAADGAVFWGKHMVDCREAGRRLPISSLLASGSALITLTMTKRRRGKGN